LAAISDCTTSPAPVLSLAVSFLPYTSHRSACLLMFDWQVELAPPPSPATTPPRISTPAPLALVINNDSSSPIAAPMQIAKPSLRRLYVALPQLLTLIRCHLSVVKRSLCQFQPVHIPGG